MFIVNFKYLDFANESRDFANDSRDEKKLLINVPQM